MRVGSFRVIEYGSISLFVFSVTYSLSYSTRFTVVLRSCVIRFIYQSCLWYLLWRFLSLCISIIFLQALSFPRRAPIVVASFSGSRKLIVRALVAAIYQAAIVSDPGESAFGLESWVVADNSWCGTSYAGHVDNLVGKWWAWCATLVLK